MKGLPLHEGEYVSKETTVSPLARFFPSLFFYRGLLRVVWNASRLAKKGVYTDEDWAQDSADTVDLLERVGVRISVRGGEHMEEVEGPCVFIANHMSTLETFVLPSIISPRKRVTFVVKQSLIDYPVFCHVMRSRDPVAVSRTNPREDFRIVMDEGLKRLSSGMSVVVFPQTTRTPRFEPEQFNSIGVKLARRAGVPVIPIALRTDAWSNGSLLKDFGRIYPDRPVEFTFGAPIEIAGGGQKEHAAIADFITEHLEG